MTRTYDPKKVALVVGSYTISGYADGSFISVERSNDMWSKSSGADGDVSRAKSNDFSGTITITLAQTSASNDVLSGFALIDEMTNQGVKSVLCTDVGGTTVLFSAFAWVKKVPTVEFSKEVGTREWALDCSDLKMLVGSNNVQLST